MYIDFATILSSNIEPKNFDRDMLAELRNYCFRHELPLPLMEIVARNGSPEAPEFVACCSWASIKCYGKSHKNKYARQLAAIEVMIVMAPQLLITMEAERRRRLTQTEVSAHSCYKNFLPHLKKAAIEVINATEYPTEKEQLLALLSALKIEAAISTVPSSYRQQPIVKVQLNVDSEGIFLDYESEIYGQMIGYFKDLLD
ncbi:uncharacterized protein LOC111075685 [Drosophila obscura]|uniref:uncharacterized protein LOC111075685 n=1 Tax=Drosophila obscura TaxID=7282 RepID=UPI001BB10AD6|nr:uncharacterized protein LOC111075685 [Drosophila obscura]